MIEEAVASHIKEGAPRSWSDQTGPWTLQRLAESTPELVGAALRYLAESIGLGLGQ